jgi:hypothetical protein
MRIGVALVALALAACPKEPAARAPGEREVVLPRPPSPMGGTGACAPDLARCPVDGCAAPASPHAHLNRLKRSTTADDGKTIAFEGATPVTVEHLKRLQAAADRVLPARRDRELTLEDRRAIARLELGDLVAGEGSVVRVAGYIAPSGRSRFAGAHEGGEESANCRLGAPNVDFHVPITASARGEDECHGIVVEIIPQGRDAHPRWTIAALRDLAQKRRLVLFVGRLFYDNEHAVRSDCTAQHEKEPRRASLWEVHPVVEMYLCADDACTADSARAWTKFD